MPIEHFHDQAVGLKLDFGFIRFQQQPAQAWISPLGPAHYEVVRIGGTFMRTTMFQLHIS